MQTADIYRHRFFTRTWRTRLLEAASRAARGVARYSLGAEDHSSALLWKRRQLWFEEQARLEEQTAR